MFSSRMSNRRTLIFSGFPVFYEGKCHICVSSEAGLLIKGEIKGFWLLLWCHLLTPPHNYRINDGLLFFLSLLVPMLPQVKIKFTPGTLQSHTNLRSFHSYTWSLSDFLSCFLLIYWYLKKFLCDVFTNTEDKTWYPENSIPYKLRLRYPFNVWV